MLKDVAEIEYEPNEVAEQLGYDGRPQGGIGKNLAYEPNEVSEKLEYEAKEVAEQL